MLQQPAFMRGEDDELPMIEDPSYKILHKYEGEEGRKRFCTKLLFYRELGKKVEKFYETVNQDNFYYILEKVT